MVHWTNLQWINRFVSLTKLYISYEGLYLAEPGLTAGSRQAGWQAGGWPGGQVGGWVGRQAGRQTKFR